MGVSCQNISQTEPMNYCSAEFPYGVNEMEQAGTPPPKWLGKEYINNIYI